MTSYPWSRGDPATDWSSLEKFISTHSPAQSRLWRGFMAARCFVAAVLLLLQASAWRSAANRRTCRKSC